MIKINLKTFWFSIILGLIFNYMISCKKDKYNDCLNNKYYVSFIANGQRICYSFCYAYLLDSIVHGQYSIYSSDYITFIYSGKANKIINDTMHLSSLLIIKFPGKTYGIYNKDSVNGIDYSIYLHTDNGNYSYPFYNNLNIFDIKGNFDLNILQYELEKNIIAGTFKGLLYSYDNKDSLLILDGEFRGILNKEKK